MVKRMGRGQVDVSVNSGASLVIVLMAILTVGMGYYLYVTVRDQRRLAAV